MIIPFIGLLKLLALGSIKLVFLLLGAIFFPVFALKMILGGASSMLMPTLDWLFQQGRLDKLRYVAIVDDLNTLSELSFTRKEARDLLFKLIKKTMKNFLSRVRAGFDHVLMIIKKITA